MQPRGQLWFALEALVRDFRDCSGLPEKDALQILAVVLGNMLGDIQREIERVNAAAAPQEPTPPAPPAP